MAEEYIAQLRDEGRFTAKIQGNGKGKYTLQDKHITGRTVNIRHQAIRQVFELLKDDAGLIANPFQAIPRMEQRPEKREAYSIPELQRIFQEADDFTRPLFLLAITTGLRRGDICTLQWREIDMERGIIVRRQRKTGQETTIPIMPQLRQFLLGLPRESEYVLPKQAEQYARNPETISRRIQATIRKSGIVPNESIEGRGRAVVRKDLHSCRHTFCWLATQAGIPLTTVQAIVGHMTPEMTAYYSDHVTDEQKIAQVNQLSLDVMEEIFGPEQGETSPRARLQAAVNALPDDKVPEAIAAIERIMSR
jgi:integrase